LLKAIRGRVAALDVSHEIIEEIAGIQRGYLSKVTADPPPKRMGAFTWFLILQAIGLDMQLVENPDLTAKLKPRWTKRKVVRKLVRPAGRIVQLTPDFYSRISRMGNEARSRNLTPERRSELARVAAEARWRRHREQKSPHRHQPRD
jgi:hypothetical protein